MMDKHSRIRDQMDTYFESKGFYRMHVARGPDSIFRSVSAALFGTQRYKDVVEEDLNHFRRTEEGVRICLNSAIKHRDAEALSKLYNLHIELVSTLESETRHISPDSVHCSTDSRDPGGREVVPVIHEFKRRHVLLCFTEPDQYDLIRHSAKVEAAGIIQSILYQILYEDVFKQERSYEASLIMMSEIPEKPISFDWNFVGTPMEALEAGHIPFPYKVAKVMDPSTYRNIEYDTWLNECKASSLETKSGPFKSITELPKGTPCLVENPDGSSSPGFVQGPTKDKRIMEVFLPCESICVFVSRKSILPLSSPTEELKFLKRSPVEKKKRIKPLLISNRQNEEFTQLVNQPQTNMHPFQSLPGSGWLEGFDASVPPPAFYSDNQVQSQCSGLSQSHSCICIQHNFLPNSNMTSQFHPPSQPVLIQSTPLSPLIAVSIPTSPLFSPTQPALCWVSLAPQYWDGSIPPPGTPLPTPGYSGPVFRFDLPGDVVQGASPSLLEPQPFQNVFSFPS